METAVAGLEPRPEGRLARARRAAWPTQETPVLIEPLGMNLVPRYRPPLNMKTSACLVQGNRVKESCGEEACEEVVVPGGSFAPKAK